MPKCACGKRPSYGYESDRKLIRCSTCKEPGMVDLKHENDKCKCGNYPIYGFEKDGKILCCKSCKKDEMIDLKHLHLLCKSDFCYTIASKKYNGYCTHCFKNLFPTDPLTFKIRTKI